MAGCACLVLQVQLGLPLTSQPVRYYGFGGRVLLSGENSLVECLSGTLCPYLLSPIFLCCEPLIPFAGALLPYLISTPTGEPWLCVMF